MKKPLPRTGATSPARTTTTTSPQPAAKTAVADRAQRLAHALGTKPRGKSPEVKAKIIARLKRLHPMD